MTDTESIRIRCMQLIATTKQLPVEAVRPDSTFEELGIDSLDKTMLAFDVEETFHISIPDSAFSTIHGVETMVVGIQTALREHVPPVATV